MSDDVYMMSVKIETPGGGIMFPAVAADSLEEAQQLRDTAASQFVEVARSPGAQLLIAMLSIMQVEFLVTSVERHKLVEVATTPPLISN